MNHPIVSPSSVAVSVAFLLGASDGDAGAPFAPEMFFVQRGHKIEYAHGFEAARGVSEITSQFTGTAITFASREVAGLSEAEAAAEADDYADDIADREFWARGAW